MSERKLIDIECDLVDLHIRLVDSYSNDRKFIQKKRTGLRYIAY